MAAVAVLTGVCLAFYVARPLIDRNYGGVSCGFRWLFWFIPLWLIAALPAADAASRTRFRAAVCLGLLAASVFSAAWSATRPWAHPWLFDYWTGLGWLAPEHAVSGGRPHRLLDARHDDIRILPEAFERPFVGEQEHLVAEPHSMLPSAVHQLPLFHVADGIVSREHWSIAIGVFEKAALFVGTRKQIRAIAMHDAPAHVGATPLPRIEQRNRTKAFEADRRGV